MSAHTPPPQSEHRFTFSRASAEHLEAIMQLEQAAYPLPWSRNSFSAIIQQQGGNSGQYEVQLLWQQTQPHAPKNLCGYFVALLGIEEVHLLNLAVHPQHQHKGCARLLLQHLCNHARQHQAQHLWLEVRQSNTRTCNIYSRFGFQTIAIRKNYYPTPTGEREHAIVMCMNLALAMTTKKPDL